jgi:putative phosphoribosyl transferase
MVRGGRRFPDRAEAGRELAARLAASRDWTVQARPVVYALPRGGVPVAREIATALPAPLDVILVRKIGAPGQPELALGAVVDGTPPQMVVNDDIRAMTGADDAFLMAAQARELGEIARRRTLYRPDRPPIDPAGCTAIVVDDGLATGATAKAALTAIRQQGAAQTVLAVPVAPVDTLAEMRDFADEVVCLIPARHFAGVGGYYDDFHQLSDDETIALLRSA